MRTGRLSILDGLGAIFGCLLAAWTAAEAAAGDETTKPACPLVTFAEARVLSVVDGRTVRLDDGREVRLAGIEIPATRTGSEADVRAAVALAALVERNEIVLKHLNPATDRYGRVIAWAFRRTGTGEEQIAALLVATGHAQAAIPPGERACMGELMAAERAARGAKLGLWGDPRYVSKRAQNPGEIAAARGRFSLVEGQVLSVRDSGGVIYVNFGRRWTEDFTVTISKRSERLFVERGLAPKSLQGRRVRVRGVVEERGGPWIEAVRPEQIELVDGN